MSSKLEKNAIWEGSFLCMLYKQLFVHPKPIPASVRLEGQTAIITGANTGIGFEASRQLLELGLSHLIITVRSQEKGKSAATQLRDEVPSAKIDVAILDLSDTDSIVSFTQSCKELERIDYAILNAAAQSTAYKRNEYTDHEAVFQTNYLSTALMTLLLAATMREKKGQSPTAPVPVLSVVGSDTMYFGDVAAAAAAAGPIFPFMDDPARYEKLQQYANTKLLLMMFVARLAEQTSPRDVILSVCNPGFTGGTGLGREEHPGFVERYLLPVFAKAVARPTAVGASVYVHALLMEREASHGSFVSDWAIKPYAPVMYTPAGRELSDRLWKETMEELGLTSSVWDK